MTAISKMVTVRAVCVVLALVVFVGFLPPDSGENATLLARYKGFLRPKVVPLAVVEPAVAEVPPVVEEKTEPSVATPKKEDPLAMYDFSDRTEGDADAPVKLYLFSSLTCVHCAHFYKEGVPFLREKYIASGKVQLIYKDFPLETRAMAASLAASCLKRDRYEPFVAALYAHQNKWMMAHNLQKALEPYAVMAGLSRDKMKECVLNTDGIKKLNAIKTENLKKYAIDATPSLIFETAVRQDRITGAPSQKQLSEKIDALLEEAGTKKIAKKNLKPKTAP